MSTTTKREALSNVLRTDASYYRHDVVCTGSQKPLAWKLEAVATKLKAQAKSAKVDHDSKSDHDDVPFLLCENDDGASFISPPSRLSCNPGIEQLIQ